MFLVAPGGQVSAVMSDAGHNFPAGVVSFIFDDAAAAVIPDVAQIRAGAWLPANYEPGEPVPPWEARGGDFSTTANSLKPI
jgi:hypothetical protein